VNQRLHDEAIEQADGLVVSTPRLIEVYGHLNPSHWVCRNYLPAAVGDIRSYLGRGARPVTVGWTGTMAVHEHDLLWLRPHAKRALAGCALQIVGDIKCFGALDADATWHHHPYQDDIYALYSLMSRCDIGIVPLEPIAFNLSKSWLKAIEFMSVGVPVVATNLPEQAALIDDGVNGFLVDEPAEFADRVQWLATHPVERAEFGVAARKKAQTLALEQHVAEWDAVLRRDPAPPEGGT
jgi:glycosyltransferase involved in cell wall biosynthesis